MCYCCMLLRVRVGTDAPRAVSGRAEDVPGYRLRNLRPPTPMTLALSVLVIIEMLNALNRYLPAYLACRVPVSMRQLLTGRRGVTGTTQPCIVPPASTAPMYILPSSGMRVSTIETRVSGRRCKGAGCAVRLRHGFLVWPINFH